MLQRCIGSVELSTEALQRCIGSVEFLKVVP